MAKFTNQVITAAQLLTNAEYNKDPNSTVAQCAKWMSNTYSQPVKWYTIQQFQTWKNYTTNDTYKAYMRAIDLIPKMMVYIYKYSDPSYRFPRKAESWLTIPSTLRSDYLSIAAWLLSTMKMESGFNIDATNPDTLKSTAFGLGQFLISTWNYQAGMIGKDKDPLWDGKYNYKSSNRDLGRQLEALVSHTIYMYLKTIHTRFKDKTPSPRFNQVLSWLYVAHHFGESFITSSKYSIASDGTSVNFKAPNARYVAEATFKRRIDLYDQILSDVNVVQAINSSMGAYGIMPSLGGGSNFFSFNFPTLSRTRDLAKTLANDMGGVGKTLANDMGDVGKTLANDMGYVGNRAYNKLARKLKSTIDSNVNTLQYYNTTSYDKITANGLSDFDLTQPKTMSDDKYLYYNAETGNPILQYDNVTIPIDDVNKYMEEMELSYRDLPPNAYIDGAFCIGDIWLTVPPTIMQIQKANSLEALPTLRTISDPVMYTGGSISPLSIQCKFADTETINYELRNIIAMMKYSPVVSVSNSHVFHLIHGAYNPNKPMTAYDRNTQTVFFITNVQMSTSPEAPDLIEANITLEPFMSSYFVDDNIDKIKPKLLFHRTDQSVVNQEKINVNLNELTKTFFDTADPTLAVNVLSDLRKSHIINGTQFTYESIPFRRYYRSFINQDKMYPNNFKINDADYIEPYDMMVPTIMKLGTYKPSENPFLILKYTGIDPFIENNVDPTNIYQEMIDRVQELNTKEAELRSKVSNLMAQKITADTIQKSLESPLTSIIKYISFHSVSQVMDKINYMLESVPDEMKSDGIVESLRGILSIFIVDSFSGVNDITDPIFNKTATIYGLPERIRILLPETQFNGSLPYTNITVADYLKQIERAAGESGGDKFANNLKDIICMIGNLLLTEFGSSYLDYTKIREQEFVLNTNERTVIKRYSLSYGSKLPRLPIITGEQFFQHVGMSNAMGEIEIETCDLTTISFFSKLSDNIRILTSVQDKFSSLYENLMNKVEIYESNNFFEFAGLKYCKFENSMITTIENRPGWFSIIITFIQDDLHLQKYENLSTTLNIPSPVINYIFASMIHISMMRYTKKSPAEYNKTLQDVGQNSFEVVDNYTVRLENGDSITFIEEPWKGVLDKYCEYVVKIFTDTPPTLLESKAASIGSTLLDIIEVSLSAMDAISGKDMSKSFSSMLDREPNAIFPATASGTLTGILSSGAVFSPISGSIGTVIGATSGFIFGKTMNTINRSDAFTKKRILAGDYDDAYVNAILNKNNSVSTGTSNIMSRYNKTTNQYQDTSIDQNISNQIIKQMAMSDGKVGELSRLEHLGYALATRQLKGLIYSLVSNSYYRSLLQSNTIDERFRTDPYIKKIEDSRPYYDIRLPSIDGIVPQDPSFYIARSYLYDEEFFLRANKEIQYREKLLLNAAVLRGHLAYSMYELIKKRIDDNQAILPQNEVDLLKVYYDQYNKSVAQFNQTIETVKPEDVLTLSNRTKFDLYKIYETTNKLQIVGILQTLKEAKKIQIAQKRDDNSSLLIDQNGSVVYKTELEYIESAFGLDFSQDMDFTNVIKKICSVQAEKGDLILTNHRIGDLTRRLLELSQGVNITGAANNPNAEAVTNIASFWGIWDFQSQRRYLELYKNIFAAAIKEQPITSRIYPTFRIVFSEKDKNMIYNYDDHFNYYAISSIKVATGRSLQPVAMLSVSDHLGIFSQDNVAMDYENPFSASDADDSYNSRMLIKPGTRVLIYLGYGSTQSLPLVFQGIVVNMSYTSEDIKLTCHGHGGELNQIIAPNGVMLGLAGGLGSFGDGIFVRELGDVATWTLKQIKGLDYLGNNGFVDFLQTSDKLRETEFTSMADLLKSYLMVGLISSVGGPNILKYINPNMFGTDDNIYLPYRPALTINDIKGGISANLMDNMTFDWTILAKPGWEVMLELATRKKNFIVTLRDYNLEFGQGIYPLRTTLYVGPKTGLYKCTDLYSEDTDKATSKFMTDLETEFKTLLNKKDFEGLWDFAGKYSKSLEFILPGITVQYDYYNMILANTANSFFRKLSKENLLSAAPGFAGLTVQNSGMSGVVSTYTAPGVLDRLWKDGSRAYNVFSKVGSIVPIVGEKVIGPMLGGAAMTTVQVLDTPGALISAIPDIFTSQNPNRVKQDFLTATEKAYDIFYNQNDKAIVSARNELQRLRHSNELTSFVAVDDIDIYVRSRQYKPVRNYHLVATREIIHNSISTGLWNGYANSVTLQFSDEPFLYAPGLPASTAPSFISHIIKKLGDIGEQLNPFAVFGGPSFNRSYTALLDDDIPQELIVEQLIQDNNIDTSFIEEGASADLLLYYSRNKNKSISLNTNNTTSLKYRKDVGEVFFDTLPTYMQVTINILGRFVSNFYSGELVIIGNPHIRDYDIIYIQDEVTTMKGFFEVSNVSHTFDDGGFVTTIIPAMLTYVSDMSASFDAEIMEKTYLWGDSAFAINSLKAALAPLSSMLLSTALAGVLSGPTAGTGSAAALSIGTVITGFFAMQSVWDATIGSWKKRTSTIMERVGKLAGRQAIDILPLWKDEKPLTMGLEGYTKNDVETHIRGFSYDGDIIDVLSSKYGKDAFVVNPNDPSSPMNAMLSVSKYYGMDLFNTLDLVDPLIDVTK